MPPGAYAMLYHIADLDLSCRPMRVISWRLCSRPVLDYLTAHTAGLVMAF